MRVRALTISIVLLLCGGLTSARSSSGSALGTVNPQVSCSGAGAHSFVGGHDGNVAAGVDSGVLSGQNNEACGPQTGIGAGAGNIALQNANGAFNGAGTGNREENGYSGFVGAGSQNISESDWDSIFAGLSNRTNNQYASILSGSGNSVSEHSSGFVGAGNHNAVNAGVAADAIGGGESNVIAAGSGASFIGGGSANSVTASSSGSTVTILGGSNNLVTMPTSNADCTKGGGCETIGGGHDNHAGGFAAAVPGGAGNVAGAEGSFAAGIRADAANRGSFVWSDDSSGAPVLKSTADNEFLARAAGGFTLYTNATNTVGATLAGGSGTWASVSDRALKRDLRSIDPAQMLAAVSGLPITQWMYRSEYGVRHIGPMAQDFAAAFHVGEDARHIATIDEAGVALAAIEALRSKVTALEKSAGGPPRARQSVPTCSGSGSNSFVGGNDGNVAAGINAGVLSGHLNQACIASSAIGAGAQNAISSAQDTLYNSFIGGGCENGGGCPFGPNTITSFAKEAFIGAGNDNTVSGPDSGIGGGEQNSVSSSSSIIAGGEKNSITGNYSFIGGGYGGAISGTYGAIITSTLGAFTSNVGGNFGFLGGGAQQSVLGDYSVVGGGYRNTSFGKLSVVAGGYLNRADGEFSAVPGGNNSQARGSLSFAAGINTYAGTAGSFVWGDDFFEASQVKSTLNNQFLARASGGYTLYTNAAGTVGATLAAGSGTWASLSDRFVKRDIVPIDGWQVLNALRRLPIREWSYRSERGVRHIGPMAQDFYAAFGVGEDDRHITMIDEDGVVLAAIQALHHRLGATTARLIRTDQTLAQQRWRDRFAIRRLRQKVSELESRVRAASRLRAGRQGN